jgi:hypothetical protein
MNVDDFLKSVSGSGLRVPAANAEPRTRAPETMDALFLCRCSGWQ